MRDEKTLIITFELQNNIYSLKYIDEGKTRSFFDYNDQCHHTQLCLLDKSGSILFEISISVENDYGTTLPPFRIDAFVPGSWVQYFLISYEKFKANLKAKEIQKKYNEEEVKNLKEKFGLQ